MDIADSLYRQVFLGIFLSLIKFELKITKVVDMWYSHLNRVVEIKTEISELDTILGKKDDDERESESLGNRFDKLKKIENFLKNYSKLMIKVLKN